MTTTNNSQVARVDAESRCSAVTSDQLVVLARSLPPAHDEGFRGARRLAATFCEGVSQAAAKSHLDREILGAISKELFCAQEWSGWRLSFCVVERRNERIRAFNCGVCGLVSVTSDQTVQHLLTPQTHGRKLRREGVSNVSPYLEHVAVTMAGAGLLANEIDEVDVDVVPGTTVIATAEPRLVDTLQVTQGATRSALADILERKLDAMNNPERAFVVWFL